MFEGINFKGDFLKKKITRKLFPVEQYLPSPVIDRDSVRGWQAAGSLDTFSRAKERVKGLLSDYKRPDLDSALEKEMRAHVKKSTSAAGLESLPEF
jgi:trimethylamine:corrinoid methyltransferase-like protein